MPESKSIAALNRLAKWRQVLTGWQVGTRSKEDPEAQAIRDQRELLLLLRAEVNAMTGLLIQRGVFDARDWDVALAHEAELLCKDLEQRFPGAHAEDYGMSIDPVKAHAWMSKFPR